jgi:purine-nucleoside phosphorylase
MSNYVKTTNFTAKDSLTTGDPGKVVRGSEIDTEFTNIATAVATKSDSASPTFTGTVTVNNITVSGTFSGTISGGTY